MKLKHRWLRLGTNGRVIVANAHNFHTTFFFFFSCSGLRLYWTLRCCHLLIICLPGGPRWTALLASVRAGGFSLFIYLFLFLKKQQRSKRIFQCFNLHHRRKQSHLKQPIKSPKKKIWKEKSNSSKVKQQPSLTTLQFDLSRTTTDLFFFSTSLAEAAPLAIYFFASFNLFHSIWGASCKLQVAAINLMFWCSVLDNFTKGRARFDFRIPLPPLESRRKNKKLLHLLNFHWCFSGQRGAKSSNELLSQIQLKFPSPARVNLFDFQLLIPADFLAV